MYWGIPVWRFIRSESFRLIAGELDKVVSRGGNAIVPPAVEVPLLLPK